MLPGHRVWSPSQPITDTDAHFLAWTSDGKAAYLKVDSLGSPEILRVFTDGARDPLAVNEFTYDLSAQPDSRGFTYTFSRGLGYGSELYLAKHDGRSSQLLYADQYNYLSFARFSPDGKQIAFIKTPDTQTPFTVGELWVINADGSNARKLAEADAGHGFAANWSPDGTFIAFVMRDNPEDESANQNSDAYDRKYLHCRRGKWSFDEDHELDGRICRDSSLVHRREHFVIHRGLRW